MGESRTKQSHESARESALRERGPGSGGLGGAVPGSPCNLGLILAS